MHRCIISKRYNCTVGRSSKVEYWLRCWLMLFFIRLILLICDWSPLPMMPLYSIPLCTWIASVCELGVWSSFGCIRSSAVWFGFVLSSFTSGSSPTPIPGFPFPCSSFHSLPRFLGNDFNLHLLHLCSLDSWMWLRRILSGVQTNIKLMIFTNNPMSPYVGWKSSCMLLSKTSSFQLIQL